MKLKLLLCSILLIAHAGIVFSVDGHTSNMQHDAPANDSKALLTEAGNDVFGTVQEVIRKLDADPNTDWDKVDLERLRQHLLEMYDMTLSVDVLSQKTIPNGIEIVVKPTTQRAKRSLKEVFSAHPAQLKLETNWTMTVKKDGSRYTLKITSNDSEDAAKIRGLGYIGLMAYGAHHQPHHWAMATGDNPHGH